MAIDFSFLEDVAPKKQEPEPVVVSGVANITIRVDADCMMQCDGEFVDLPLKAGMMAKTQLPIGQHLLEFFSSENPNIKIEKVVDFPESDKNYLIMVNELKAAIAPPTPQEPVVVSGVANITISVDADCMMQCDGEFVDLPLKAGMMAKTQLPIGQHLLEFFSSENPNIKIEKVVDFPESDKNYLIVVNELKAAIAPPTPQNSIKQQSGTPPQNSYLDQLNQMARMNPLANMGMTQMPPPPPPMPTTPFNNINKKK